MEDRMRTMFAKPPLHPLSALATIVIDGLSTVAELAAAATLVGALLVPVLVVVSGLLSLAVVIGLERFLARQAWKTALTAGVVMGLLTALPFFFFGGLAGLAVLVWAGIYEWQKSLPPG
jgi:hypothetical protein